MLISMFVLQEKDKQVNATLHNRPMYVYTISLSGSAERCFTFFTVKPVKGCENGVSQFGFTGNACRIETYLSVKKVKGGNTK